MKSRKIGFISTRLAGTDGVSLETRKWAEILEREGHQCFYMAGELDWPDDVSFLVPELHFNHEDIFNVNQELFANTTRKPETTEMIDKYRKLFKKKIGEFVKMYDLELLIPENAVTIPLNIPLGVAIAEYAAETGMKMIAHNHDFFWERKRFLNNCCWDYLGVAFPPSLPSVQHAVLNSVQERQLSFRKGVSVTVVPNIMDYANPPAEADGYGDDMREELGIKPDEKFILQPTRIVQRKGIEHAIELVHRMNIPAKLVISHASGDEGVEYFTRVKEYSKLMGVETVLCSDNVGEERGKLPDGRKIYTLADMYQQADLVTYPSTIEGFGNAYLEAVYYKVPIMVNNYSIYNTDIKPKGFRAIEIDEYVHEDAVEFAKEVLSNPELAKEMVDHNYELGQQFFSYEIVSHKLRAMLDNCFGIIS